MVPLTVPATHPTLPFADTATRVVRPVQADAPRGWSAHLVRPGDSLFDLALRHRTSVDALVSYNGLGSASAVLRPGQRLMVPAGTSSSARVTTTSVGADDTHVVRPGETLGGIAERASVSVAALMRANGLTSRAVILPGQRLVVPEGRAVAKARVKHDRGQAARTSSRVVTVREGDSVAAIADRYGVSVASILKANGLASGGLIQPGQRLRIVGVSAAASPAPAASQAGPDAGRIAAAAAANRRYLAAHPGPGRSAVKDMVRQEARRQGVDPRLALAVAWQESRWTQRAVSEANALGVMQCLPSTGRWVSSMVGRDLDLLDTRDNITCGVALLRSLQRSAHTEEETIAAYYQGLTSVRERGHFDDTRAYVASVQRHRDRM